MRPDQPLAERARKYARAERERRFLLSRVPDGSCIGRAAISDLYISGTRMRLRRTIETTASGTTVMRKLTQKIPGSGGGPGSITTFYLTDAEFEVLRLLPAVALTKARYRVPPLSIDVFTGALDGLVVGEAEFGTADEEDRFGVPVDAVAEITLDGRLTGDRLARMPRSDLLVILGAFGLETVDASELATRTLQ